MPSDRIIGIDFGTTNSVVAIVDGGEPVIVPSAEGENRTPSIVAFLDNGDVIVGEKARRQAITNPKRTISSVKRMVGRSFEDIDESGDVFPFEIVNHDGNLLIDIDGMGYRAEQIGAFIFQQLRQNACTHTGEDVTKAVVTVPAYFDDLQRQSVIESAKMAGLEVLRLINEPTAAAMAYGVGKSSESDEIIAIFDFGGGTFDITILEIVGKTFEVLCSTGDSHLGGDDLDNVLVNRLVQEFYEKHGIDLSQDATSLRRLKEVCERGKIELSSATSTRLSLPFFAQKDGQPIHLDRQLSRTELEELIEPFVNRTIKCCRRALEDSKIAKRDIKKVILVGGSTRIPLVQDAVEDFFGLAPFKGVNPDEVVSLGAAAQAGIFEGNIQEVVLLDVTPHSLGIEVKDGKFSKIIEKNSTIPIKAAKTFTTTEDNQSFVNVHILQGESEDAAQNRSLGKFTLSGIPAATAGVPRIKVTFFINADGVTEISAEDQGSGAAKSLKVIHSQLDQEERRTRRRRRQRTSESALGGALARAGGTATRQSGKADSAVRKMAGGSGIQLTGRKADSTGGATVPLPGAVPPPPPKAAPRQQRPDDSPVEALPPSRPAARIQDAPAEPVAMPPSPSVRPQPAPATSPAPVDYRNIPQTYTNPSRASGPSVPRPPAEVPPPPPAAPPSRPAVPAGADATAFDLSQEPTRFYNASELVGAPQELPPSDVPAAIAALRSDLEKFSDDQPTLARAAAAIEQLSSPPFDTSTNFEVLEMRGLLHMAMGQQDETRQALVALHAFASQPTRVDYITALYDKFVSRFPSSAAARRARAVFREFIGDLAGACEDVEQAGRQDPSDDDGAVLERLYRARMKAAEDPAAMFKLVKIFLKTNRMDDAVVVLDDLQRYDSYHTRAVKILGLCHWQQNLHHVAWQKFRLLPMNDELKDILYRLASDMERTDQLPSAVEVLEHLLQSDPGYRDAGARLKKLAYRLKLQGDDADAARFSNVLTDPRFTIIEEINRGSMGIIYKAKDKTLDEVVALKILNDFLCQDPSAVERFKREARAAKKLSHPYIVRIHDMFETGNKRFISMEYIEGTDLKRLISERTTFTEDMIVYYMVQILDAMSYAHRLGVVHRDIKPANIMITKDNTVKITDFGIAKLLKNDDGTKSGTAVIGTPLYMAPEQITGSGVDARSDIYAIGILMYELASGNPPFYLGNIEYHHIHTAPPPLPERVNAELKRIILKCIEKEAERRFQTVDDILEAVRSIKKS